MRELGDSGAAKAWVAGTTPGVHGVVDRHHVNLPVIGVRRTKEPTDKLRLRLEDASAKILRATLLEEGRRRFVSFNVIVKREARIPATQCPSGTDVGIAHLATSSDCHVVENRRAEKQARQKVNRYQRQMDRQLSYRHAWFGAILLLASSW